MNINKELIFKESLPFFKNLSKEEKNMQNPYKDMQSRLDTLQHEFSRKLASHGYINNSYVRGE